jgi:hypothetical protein
MEASERIGQQLTLLKLQWRVMINELADGCVEDAASSCWSSST